LAGLVAAAVVLSAWGIGDYVSAPAGEPLVGPLGYANGAGALAAIAIVVVLGLAFQASGGWVRLAALAPLTILVPALVLTKSAGAWLALFGGLLVLVAADRRSIPRRAFLAAASCVAGGAIVWL